MSVQLLDILLFPFPKNKKQRMMVRAAVLKMKDPKQIIRDMEKLDEMGKNLFIKRLDFMAKITVWYTEAGMQILSEAEQA